MKNIEYSSTELEKLHLILLELLDKFIEICEKYQLNYSLGFGTLLGAVRHKGFIPWDDDVDLVMPRSDYEKFLKVAQKELGNKYYLDYNGVNKEYFLPFAKIKKNGTIFDEEACHHINNHKGIFIDIFPIDNVYDNLKRSYFDAFIIKTISQTVYVKKKISKINETNHPVVVTILRLLSTSNLVKIENRLCKKNKDNKSKYMVNYTSDCSFQKELILREDFFPNKVVLFENRKCKIMNNYDKYLKNLYGDYMSLPPKEKRINHRPLELEFGDNI